MSRVKFELNREGVRELLQSPEIESVVKSYADKARSRLGEGYEVTTHKGATRVNASIAATTYQTRKDNLENNTLLKALGTR